MTGPAGGHSYALDSASYWYWVFLCHLRLSSVLCRESGTHRVTSCPDLPGTVGILGCENSALTRGKSQGKRDGLVALSSQKLELVQKKIELVLVTS